VSTAAPRSITDRMIGALRLDESTYEEVEADTTATSQAAFVVVGTSLVAAAGNALLRGGEVNGGIIVAIAQLVGWAVNAWLAYLIGTKIIPGPQTRSTWGEVARTLGFANTPRVFLLFVAVPGITGLVRTVVGLWVLIATLVALRSALDCGTGRALAVAVISTLAQLAIIAIVINSLG
jgi:Yip1-like protein